uniref:Bifunctional endo-1,4-beta-xylanase xylA n=1 Tax=Solanum tuberosum TaxID=4113 RepID=M1DH02_SOLTU
MARETPPELPRPPDELQKGRLNDSNKTQLATLSNSSHNSTKLQNTNAINTAISVKELEGTREFISTGDNTLIRGKGIGNMESTNLDLQHSKKPSDSTVPIARNREAISKRIANSSPEMCPQIRATSSQIRADSVTGDYSPHDEVHLPENSSKMDGGIVAGENSDKNRIHVARIYAKAGKRNLSPPVDIHPSEISSNLDEGNTNNNQSIQPAEVMLNMNKGTSQREQEVEQNDSFPAASVGHNVHVGAIVSTGTKTMQEENNSMQQMNLPEQQAIDQIAMKQASANLSKEAQSSNFSFGVAGNSLNITPNSIPCALQDSSTQDRPTEEPGHDHQQSKEQTSSGQQTKGKVVLLGKSNKENNAQTDATNADAHLHNGVNEQISRIVELSEQGNKQVQKAKEGQMEQHKDINQPGGTTRIQQGNDRANLAYQNNFPKISNNYTRYDPNSQRNRNDTHQANHTAAQGIVKQPNKQQTGQAQNNNKQDIIHEPAPFTIVQSFAARLRYNQSKNEIPIVLDSPVFTTRQGLPAVLLEEDDYNIKLAESCKHTLVGKFTNTMPKMEIIRKSFTIQTQLTGGVKITHYDSRHEYIDLDNEFDYVTVWTKQRMSIEGQLMRIQAWTPEFTPEEETPIVPIWVALPELPWHCYNKVLLTIILSPIGKVLYLDSPSS